MMRVAGRASGTRIAARLVSATAAVLLAGCFATTKHVELVEADVTRRGAWTEEKIKDLTQEISALKAENDALKARVDDLTDKQTSLSGEVATRLSELQEADQKTSEEARRAADRAAALGQNREQDRTDLLQRMNVILDEVVKENKDLRARIDAIEASSATSAHTVQAGETLASIAAKYGTTAQAIVAANGLPDADHIQVGQRLTIPGH
ncbi:MAG: LysM peptidoglycan-binding domain-containing protein [bacterium]